MNVASFHPNHGGDIHSAAGGHDRKRRRRAHLLRPMILMQDRCDRRRWWRRRFRRLVRVAWLRWITLAHAVRKSIESPKTVIIVVVTVLVRGRGKAHAAIEVLPHSKVLSAETRPSIDRT